MPKFTIATLQKGNDIMATAKKLPSGSWRCLVYDYTDSSGKRHYKSFTSDNPGPKGKREAEFKAAQYAESKKTGSKSYTDYTFKEAAQKYIELKKNVLSPSTIRGYLQMLNSSYTDALLHTRISDFNKIMLQEWVNDYCIGHSPKSVRNAYGFLTSVIYYFRDDIVFKVKLPAKIKYDAYVPNDSEVQELINYHKEHDKDMLVASCLAAFGTLRRSEVCGLGSDFIAGNMVKIRRAMVKDSNESWILKNYAKNDTSSRDIPMPKFVIDMLPDEGMAVSINPSQITHRHEAALKKLKIPYFRFHDLRHYSATIMHTIGVPDQYIMQRGGWSSDRVLKEVYRGTIDEYNKKFEDKTLNYFETMQHEMQHKKIKA